MCMFSNYQEEKAQNIYGVFCVNINVTVFWRHLYDNTYFLRNTPLEVILAENYLTNKHDLSRCKRLLAAPTAAEMLQRKNDFSLVTTGGSYITRVPVQSWYTLATKREVVILLEFSSQSCGLPMLMPVVTSHAMS